MNAYKTIASGNFQSISIWAVWDGFAWNPATVKPGQGNDIYIDQTHTLTLTANESVKSVFINAETGAGQKLVLSGFQLHVYGSLHAFSGAAPGTPDNAWNSQNWIGNSISSTIVFKGTSRVISQKNSWSAQTTQSRFAVVFEADPGETLTLEAPFKALSFTIRSGTLLQKVDTSVIPNTCFTLSFNTETSVFGSGPFGSLSIEPGATFISQCNANILNRSTSGTTSALNFDLQNGGTLILEGNAPRIEAANFQLNGKVIFRGGSAAKNYLASTYSDASAPIVVRDIEIQGNQNLSLPSQLTLLGSLEKTGSGNFIATGTSLTLAGSGDQEIIGFPLSVRDLNLNKPSGTFFPNSPLTILRNLTLTQGSMDLGGNNMAINTGLAGSLSYAGGSWKNVGLFSYHGLPASLTGTNATFPFEDSRNGGIRKVQLLGNSSGGNLTIALTEYTGAEYNSGFDDVDGTKILYRLFSFFQFTGMTPSPNPLELRISADKLIVDDVDDLRIVGTGYPAPGNHLPGLDPTELWARRSLTFADLDGKNFTVGSFRTLSVLPIRWLDMRATQTDQGILLKWKVLSADEDLLFEIHKSPNPLESMWEKIGEASLLGGGSSSEEFLFLDKAAKLSGENYYRIKQVDQAGNAVWSKVVKASLQNETTTNRLLISPNPYSSGPLHLELPDHLDWKVAEVVIQNFQGKLLGQYKYPETDLAEVAQNLPPGVYFIWVISEQHRLAGKLIRK
ncbi:T9SS C-terminal target domain-containing protein [Algoriphagus sp. H41]|uniref:T9SS C-terminal target domain-containing protein n=1 Tax=Algoriphagus oliviformis TaxID=2811231 RepID=A0ABS3C081_9BACT|nr:T9SS C-terminal target domain-containing protein [Algoriphagus oliviformis]MBN7809551.1 T9SS C-terminal target domain-containing protein [Algoriphagus oliviformis]